MMPNIEKDLLILKDGSEFIDEDGILNASAHIKKCLDEAFPAINIDLSSAVDGVIYVPSIDMYNKCKFVVLIGGFISEFEFLFGRVQYCSFIKDFFRKLYCEEYLNIVDFDDLVRSYSYAHMYCRASDEPLDDHYIKILNNLVHAIRSSKEYVGMVCNTNVQ
jgi:hypothetical protein